MLKELQAVLHTDMNIHTGIDAITHDDCAVVSRVTASTAPLVAASTATLGPTTQSRVLPSSNFPRNVFQLQS